MARPCNSQDVCRSFAGRCPRDQGPPAVLGASRLFVLLVAARRWVLAGNKITIINYAKYYMMHTLSTLHPSLDRLSGYPVNQLKEPIDPWFVLDLR